MNITKEMLDDNRLWDIRINEAKWNIFIKSLTYSRLKSLYPDFEWKGDLKEISKLAVKKLYLEHILKT